MRRAAVVAVLAVLLALLLWLLPQQTAREPVSPAPENAYELGNLMSGDVAGYARAHAPRPFVFPEDHGPHPAYKHEWWYWTGNLQAEDGRRFGFQLTVFRIAMTPTPVARASAWRGDQVYMAHFALTDVAGRRFYHAERFSRGALDLAGAQAAPFRVWLEDWVAAGPPAGETPFPLRLQASEADFAIDLVLEPVKPHVLQGEQGLSQKSAEPGNASYYYSFTRLAARGEVRSADARLAVSGSAWWDREWSSSALGADQVGWDWFSLQLSDGREVMYYQMRRRDGSVDPHSKGVLVGARGEAQLLRHADVELTVLDHWESPRGGRYPARWRLTVADLDLLVQPFLSDQEMDTLVRYWEGAVQVQGRAGDAPVDGVGYVELTGYANEPGEAE
ncbi:carotenoid 1,2-hydratase [Ectothiorhodospiraceae bacterium 2226]|nr:carotenoid 1,2-hydratase [Ectothiorhodospiraceae bacterium 2226]